MSATWQAFKFFRFIILPQNPEDFSFFISSESLLPFLQIRFFWMRSCQSGGHMSLVAISFYLSSKIYRSQQVSDKGSKKCAKNFIWPFSCEQLKMKENRQPKSEKNKMILILKKIRNCVELINTLLVKL